MFNFKILTGVAIAATCLFSSCVDLDQDPLGSVEAGKIENERQAFLRLAAVYSDMKDFRYTWSMMAFGEYDAVIASRMLGHSALKGGMPLYKYVSNRFLTEFENFVIGEKLSEYHTGFRGFTREILEKLPLEDCSDDFIFDNEMLALILYNNYKIGEISCPTKYFAEASSINFVRSCKYGLEVLKVSIMYRLAKIGLGIKLFNKGGQALDTTKELVYYYKREK